MNDRPSREVRDAIEDLTADNLWALDTRDLDRYVATYWEDGLWIDTRPDGSVTELSGATAIREGTAGYLAQPADHQHRMQHPVYRRSPSGWTVSSYYFSTRRDPANGAVTFVSCGTVQDEVEERGGAWRIRERRIRQWDGSAVHPLAGA